MQAFLFDIMHISSFICIFVLMYAILDIETTGLSPANEKIIEIAVFIHDGDKIVEEYNTLVNP
ncbi:MAG: hypothetical protein C0597_05785 [Marinilabiliales bacterium]|nr:MAG: hypothetical protein C0597_05785 [Marinilabiliales bacterium]